MNRISSVVATAGALTLILAGCGSADEATDASGLRKGTPASTTAPATTTSKAAASGSQVTCSEFKSLDNDAQTRVIEQILADNPGGPFEGSPNVALGTAKLVCLAPGNADKTVAEAAGMTP
ncbi:MULTISPECIES: hypothetical protein [Nocardia]|uniref:Acid stress chaperone HdeA n=2 Tax=Nocardia TaxID=1817 RepID=A0A4R6PX30_NOCIG|nr:MULTISPECIES: hypothetical protein [Nocardia]NKX87702.1 hypothetical protein [Nocardia coubleae]TDP42933.1 hypothetical protein DFR75_1012051 [Nocardia ignorata]